MLTGRIVEQGGLTTVMVTHNMQQAIALGNRLIMMHEGRIVFSADEQTKKTLTVEARWPSSARSRARRSTTAPCSAEPRRAPAEE